MQYWVVKKNKKSNTDNSPVFRLYPKIEKKNIFTYQRTMKYSLSHVQLIDGF